MVIELTTAEVLAMSDSLDTVNKSVSFYGDDDISISDLTQDLNVETQNIIFSLNTNGQQGLSLDEFYGEFFKKNNIRSLSGKIKAVKSRIRAVNSKLLRKGPNIYIVIAAPEKMYAEPRVVLSFRPAISISTTETREVAARVRLDSAIRYNGAALIDGSCRELIMSDGTSYKNLPRQITRALKAVFLNAEEDEISFRRLDNMTEGRHADGNLALQLKVQLLAYDDPIKALGLQIEVEDPSVARPVGYLIVKRSSQNGPVT